MRRSVKCLLIGSLLISVLTKSAFAQMTAASEKLDGETQKVIAVVLDDSTSMVRDDPGTKQTHYTTRWVEADYAVRALAAMMADGDILRVYPLNKGEPVSVTIGEDDLEAGLFERLDSMGYYGFTLFDRVREATSDLKHMRQKDPYLVVITDGNFQQKSRDGKIENMTKEALDNEFNKILRSSNIGAHYIQIGEKENNIIPSSPYLITHSEVLNGVTKQITDVINNIYYRVAMDETDKKSLVSSPSEDSLAISFNIPVRNVTVFLQGNADWTNIQVSGTSYAVETAEVHPKTPNFPELWKSENETCITDYIKSLQITGLVIRCSADGGSMEPITISGVPSANKEQTQIYYEPAVEQRVSISQKDGISFIYGESVPLFVEGPVDLTIDYLQENGLPLDNPSASMLKAGSTAVSLDGRTFSKVPQADSSYVFSGALTPGDAHCELTISNAIGLNGGSRTIPLGEIYEPNLSLSAELQTEDDGLVLDRDGNGTLTLLLSNQTKGSTLTQKEWDSGIKLECSSAIFGVNQQGICFQNGSVQIPISLKNIEEHQLEKTEVFSITATKTYNDGIRPDTVNSLLLPAVSVGSVPHTLSANWEGDLVKLVWAVLFGRTIPITYSCDGEPLTDRQLRNATLTLEHEDPAFDGLITLENGNLHLTSGLNPFMRWRNMQNVEDYAAKLVFSYTKWNQTDEISEPIVLELIPLSNAQLAKAAAQLILFLLLLSLVIVFFVWFFFGSGKREDYIRKNISFGLQSHDDPTESGYTRLKWNIGSWLFFRADFRKNRCAHLSRHISSEQDDGSLYVSIDLYVRREGDGWSLEKLSKTKPSLEEGSLRIGGVPVSSDKRHFLTGEGSRKRLELKRPKFNHGWLLKIEEEDCKG